jgi:hypothetical protein
MPQKIYKARSLAHHRRYRENAELQDPIIFRGKSMMPGVPLREVLKLSEDNASCDELLVDPHVIVLDYGVATTKMSLQVGFLLFFQMTYAFSSPMSRSQDISRIN